MPVREMIEIDEDLCNGCGDCVPACEEGAIAIVDGKAKLISDVYCDGLGACLGHCPQGALTVVRREAEDFDEEAVEKHLATQKKASERPTLPMAGMGGGCPGSRVQEFAPSAPIDPSAAHEPSQLRQWPVQLHLVPPTAPFFNDADLLLAADCVAFTTGAFHTRFLKDHALAIACPKLDSNQETYLHKLVSMIDDAKLKSITVMVMEVPCCSGLVHLLQEAVRTAKRAIPVHIKVVSVRGDILAEQELGVA